MVLVVVFVHAVAPDQEQVVEAVDIFADLVEALVGAEVGRIGFGHADDAGIENVVLVDDADFFHFLLRQRDHVGVGQLPEIVGLVTEVFESDPDIGGIARPDKGSSY